MSSDVQAYVHIALYNYMKASVFQIKQVLQVHGLAMNSGDLVLLFISCIP